MIRIIEDDLSGTDIRALLEFHFAGMRATSPPGTCHFLDFDGLKGPGVTFWSIWDGDSLGGCGALKQHDAALGEIKSMRTHNDHLRRGFGARMLEHIISEAQARGLKRLSLETGSGDPFAAATALYERYGFGSCGPFADYVDTPFNRYMTRTL